MIEQFCTYYQQKLKRVKDKYICPNHGAVLMDKSEEDENDKKIKSYIG